jgi:hypothetical protein
MGMILRAWLPGVLVLALAACDPPVPDSAAGVGFGDYQGYLAEQDALRAQRDQQLSGQVSVTPPTATGAPTPAQVQGAPVLTTDAPGTATGVAVAVASNPDISDEQDFGAVSGRESIEANAERLARQRQQYQQVAPTALPNRPAGDGPSIVAYALQTTNQVGEQIYSRALGSDRRAARACSGFTAPDKAQQAFLELGGPQRDRKGMDPDGDGFVCGWSPNPFRSAVQG